MAAGMPCALWLWHRAADAGAARSAAAAVGSLVLQWLSCIYYGLLFAPFLGVMIAADWLGIPADRRRRVFAGLAVAALAGVVVIALYSMPYLANRDSTGDRDAADVTAYSATLSSYLGVSPHNALYGGWLSRFGGAESRLFPGFAAAALAVVGLVAGPWNRRRWGYLAAGVLAFDLSLGANGILFPLLREWVLPYRGLRAPGRAGVMVAAGRRGVRRRRGGVHSARGCRRSGAARSSPPAWARYCSSSIELRRTCGRRRRRPRRRRSASPVARWWPKCPWPRPSAWISASMRPT